MTSALATRTVEVVPRKTKEPGSQQRGARVRERRDMLNLSQEGAAQAMEPPMSQGWWADLETGRGSANPHQLTELARVLRTSVSYLLLETDDPRPITGRLSLREKTEAFIADLSEVDDGEALDLMFQLQDEVRRRAERMRGTDATVDGGEDGESGTARRKDAGPDVSA